MSKCSHPQTIPYKIRPGEEIIKGRLCLRCRHFLPDPYNCPYACCTPEAKARR